MNQSDNQVLWKMLGIPSVSRDLHYEISGKRLLAPEAMLFATVFSASRVPHKDLTEEGNALARRIFGIDGVLHMEVRPWKLEVRVGLAFNWRKMHRRILRALKRIAFPGVEETVSVKKMANPYTRRKSKAKSKNTRMY